MIGCSCVTGDWTEGEARDLAGPDADGDDEAYGEVIDMETGEPSPSHAVRMQCLHFVALMWEARYSYICGVQQQLPPTS